MGANLVRNGSSGHLVSATSGHLVFHSFPAACLWPDGGLDADYNVAFSGTILDDSGQTPFVSPETISQGVYLGMNCAWSYSSYTGVNTYIWRVYLQASYWYLYISSDANAPYGRTYLNARKYTGVTPAGNYTVYSRFTHGGTNTIDDIQISLA